MIIWLFSSLLLLIPPFLFISVYYLHKDYNHWRRYLWMYVLALGTLSYSYVANPEGGGDLLRYIERMHLYSYYDLPSVLEHFYWEETGATIWMWLVSKTGLEGLLSGIPTTIVYAIASYITCDYAERKDIKEKISYLLLLQLVLLPFISIVYNIFCVCSFALIVFAAYRELVQGKRNILTVSLYILPCFFHVAGVSLLLVRICASLLKTRTSRLVALTAAFMMPAIVSLIFKHISLFSGIKLLYDAINRVWFYLYVDDSDYARQVSASMWYRVLYLGNMIYAVSIVYSYLKWSIKLTDFKKCSTTNEEKSEVTFCSFIYIIAVICIGCSMFSVPHYWRYAYAAILGQSIFVIRNFSFKKKVRRISLLLMWLSGSIITLLYIYKIPTYVNLTATLGNFFLSSPYYIVIKLIINIIG